MQLWIIDSKCNLTLVTDSLELLITDYLADYRNEGKAARSLAVYRQALDDYAGWTAARGKPDDLDAQDYGSDHR